ncbi:RICIN domain-containing protein [Actinosynnema sp. NPDC047251]|uniref:Ricin B lectin domain-containing protein n=1 Tax=Saccharothrix espanaensis (strain ATCC 51144 / DSM 44229 / JCM 9112 / NBRC 15066 / NRRL 15764) TaxID=1179773 RepID=K0K4D9_SACES|nr:RICIN domain-containing protein [Saccharothrix espanaensis]CCH31729.1 hypothetical protein BN6_44480 [Saccharothrix espanaensis DSM 44229]
MLRKLWTMVAVAVFSAVIPAGTALADDEVVYIVSRANNRCLDATAQWNGVNGTPIQLWDCYPPTQYNQMWRIHWVSDYEFQLIGVASGRCLDATGMGTAAGTRLQLWDCLGPNQRNQIWKSLSTNTPGYRWIMGQHSAKVVDAVANQTGSNGTPVQLWHLIGDETQTNQRWAFKRPGDF